VARILPLAKPDPRARKEMEEGMLTSLLVGLVVGFVLAMPPGPIAIACLRHALEGKERHGVALALGASAIDSVSALLAASASSALVSALWGLVTDNAWVLLAFQGGCIMLLVVLGLRAFQPIIPVGEASPRQAAVQAARAPTLGGTSPYLVGVLLALTNLASPIFLPSLIFVLSLAQAQGWVGHTVGEHALYAVGFGAGAALWFVLLLRTLTMLRVTLAPQVIPILARVAGGVLLLCAGILTYHVVTATAWARLPGWPGPRGWP
jgi:threonine/homoserine/homoserine lactone efflux protein